MSVSDAKRLKQLEDENAKLRRVVVDQAVDNVALKDVLKEMVKPVMKRSIAGYLQEKHGLSKRRACALVGTATSVLRYCSKKDDSALQERMSQLATERPRFGYRRLHVLLQREDMVVNRKKTYRLYKQANLHLHPKKRKRITSSTGVVVQG